MLLKMSICFKICCCSALEEAGPRFLGTLLSLLWLFPEAGWAGHCELCPAHGCRQDMEQGGAPGRAVCSLSDCQPCQGSCCDSLGFSWPCSADRTCWKHWSQCDRTAGHSDTFAAQPCLWALPGPVLTESFSALLTKIMNSFFFCFQATTVYTY